MSEDRRRILEMLSQGTVNVQDAEDLLKAIGRDAGEASNAQVRINCE